MTWQPIETAPKDGTTIWAFEGGAQTSVRWCEYDYWELIVTGDGAIDSDEFSPTHWMPLPEAPQLIENTK